MIDDFETDLPRKAPSLWAALSTALIVGLLLATFLVKGKGRGLDDLAWAIAWTLPLLGLVAGAAGLIGRSSQALWSRLLVGGILSFLLGVLWSFGAVLFLGGFAGAISIPMVVYWPVGAAIGTVIGLALSAVVDKRIQRRVLIAGIALALSVGLFLSPVVSWVRSDRQLEVVWVRWTPGEGQLSIRDHSGRISVSDLELLKAAGVGGELEVRRSGREGRGRKVRMLLILQDWVDQEVVLLQPAEGTVIYLQRKEGFAKLPPDAPTLARSVGLYPGVTGASGGGYWIDTLHGRQTGDAINLQVIRTTDAPPP